MGSVFIKIKYILKILIIAIILSVSTHILPIFFDLPRWILLNIAGTFLVSYSLGPIYGILYAGLLNVVISSIGMGSGIIINVLLTQMIEAGLIGLLRFKKINDILNIILISFVLSIVIRPLGNFLYALFNNQMSWFIDNIVSIYTDYLKTDFVSNLIIYLISSILGYLIYKFMNRFKIKKEGAM